jgi:hypothetical protein
MSSKCLYYPEVTTGKNQERKSKKVSDKNVQKIIRKWSKPKCNHFKSSWLHGPRLVVIHHLRYPGTWGPGNSRGPIRSQACGPIRSQAWGPIRSRALGAVRKQSRGKTFPVRHSSCLGTPETVFVNLLRSSGIDNTEGQPYLSYRPSRLNRLAESIPRTRFLGSINVYKYGHTLQNIYHNRYTVKNIKFPVSQC